MIKHTIIWLFIITLCTIFGRGESGPDPVAVAEPIADPLHINQRMISYPEPPPIGSGCTTASDCSTANSDCIDNVCACKTNFLTHGNACLEPKNLDDSCQNVIQCPINAVCSTNCACASAYLTILGQCLPQLNLGDECIYDLQCSSTTTNSECSGSPSKACACAGDLRVSTSDTCVPATIPLRMEQPFNDAYHADMAVVGSVQYGTIETKLLGIYSAVPNYISVTELTIEDDGSGNTLTKFLLTTSNPDLASLRYRREADPYGDDILERVRRHAVAQSELQGHSGRGIVVRVERGGLHAFCMADTDCAVTGSTCTSSACSCTFGFIADGDEGIICKKSSFY